MGGGVVFAATVCKKKNHGIIHTPLRKTWTLKYNVCHLLPSSHLAKYGKHSVDVTSGEGWGEYFQQHEIYDKKIRGVIQIPLRKTENWTLKYNVPSPIPLQKWKKKLMMWQLRGVITAWKKSWSYSKVSSEKFENKIQCFIPLYSFSWPNTVKRGHRENIRNTRAQRS